MSPCLVLYLNNIMLTGGQDLQARDWNYRRSVLRCQVSSTQASTSAPLPTNDPETRRRPAWTDRIFYHAADWTTLKQVSYSSHSDISLSDHKPVSADFELEVREFVSISDNRILMFIIRRFRWIWSVCRIIWIRFGRASNTFLSRMMLLL